MVKMKIGLVMDTTLDSDAGVQQYFKGLARFFLSKGHDVKFLVPSSANTGEFKGKIFSFGYKINPIGNVTGVPISFCIGERRKIRKVLEQEEFDILHISAPFSPFLGAKIVHGAQCPVVLVYLIHTKNWLYRLGAIFLRKILFKAYKKIDAHIAISEIAKKEAEQVIPAKFKLIPNGVDLSIFSSSVRPLKRFSASKLNVLFIGRLEERKGADFLIKAFKVVKEELKNVRLIIAGDGPKRRALEALVTRLNLKDVFFEGYVEEEVKPRYYASADLCVFPAIYGESFGVVLIEAMASGKVPVAFSNEGYSFVLRNLPELLVENKNVKKLAVKIVKFLQDGALRREYEKKCLREKEQFGWEKVGSQILMIYKKLLKRSSSR